MAAMVEQDAAQKSIATLVMACIERLGQTGETRPHAKRDALLSLVEIAQESSAVALQIAHVSEVRKVMVKCMQSDNLEMQASATRVIWQLSRPKETKLKMAQTPQLLHTLVCMLMDADTSVEQVLLVLGALESLASEPANKSDMGLFPDLLDELLRLQVEGTTPDVILRATRTLWRLISGNLANKKLLLEYEDASAIIKTICLLDKSTPDATREVAARMVWELTCQMEDGKKAMVSMGVVQKLLPLMERGMTDTCRDAASGALSSLARSTETAATVMKTEGFTEALYNLILDDGVPINSVQRALEVLGWCITSNVESVVRAVWELPDLIATCIAVINRTDLKEVHKQLGARLIWHAATQSDEQRLAVAAEEDCITTLVTMLQTCKETKSKVMACGALWNISYDITTNKVCMAETPGVLTSLKTECNNDQATELLLKYARGALKDLAVHRGRFLPGQPLQEDVGDGSLPPVPPPPWSDESNNLMREAQARAAGRVQDAFQKYLNEDAQWALVSPASKHKKLLTKSSTELDMLPEPSFSTITPTNAAVQANLKSNPVKRQMSNISELSSGLVIADFGAEARNKAIATMSPGAIASEAIEKVNPDDAIFAKVFEGAVVDTAETTAEGGDASGDEGADDANEVAGSRSGDGAGVVDAPDNKESDAVAMQRSDANDANETPVAADAVDTTQTIPKDATVDETPAAST